MRIATWNTWKNTEPYEARLEGLTAVLRAQGPDLVLLQEAFVSTEAGAGIGAGIEAGIGAGADTARTLADALGLRVTAAPSRAKARLHGDRWVESTNGLALLARDEPTEHRVLVLPGDPGDPDRIAQIARVGALTVVNLHLTHLKGADALRTAQVEAALATISAAGPVLIGGDFNAGPTSAVVAVLRDAGFTDLAGTDPFATCAGRRIDFLFGRGVVAAGPATPLGAEPVNGVLPSDHTGILVTLAE